MVSLSLSVAFFGFFCFATTVSSLPQCNTESSCTYTLPYAGGTVTLDLRGLCNKDQDYSLVDAVGHTYYAQICGTANKKCLPHDWENQYEYGVAIQTWGSTPDCDNSCVEESTGAEVCCSEPCQVIAVQSPVVSFITPGNPKDGFQVTYTGEIPTSSDPYHCDYDYTSNSYFARVTNMQFICDWNQDGYANFFEVDQNATDDCMYTMKFKTSAACVGTYVSGGWVFSLIVIFSAIGYVGGAFGWSFYKTRTCTFPESQVRFWDTLNGFVLEGILFTLNGFKKPNKRALEILHAGQPLLSASGGATDAPKSSSDSGAKTSSSSIDAESGSYQSSSSSNSSLRNSYTSL